MGDLKRKKDDGVVVYGGVERKKESGVVMMYRGLERRMML